MASEQTSDKPKRTILPNPRLQPRYAGITTYARFPQVESVPPANRPIDWIVYGYAYDGGVTYRPGTRFGPRAIRDASQYVKPYHIEHDLDLTETLSCADAGDAPVKPFDCKDNLDTTVEFARALPDPAHTRLLALGGDHSCAYANLKATWTRLGKPAGGLTLVHFDSHTDTTDITGGERFSHASPFIRLIEEGALDPKRMISIGIKGPLNTKSDLAYAPEHGIELITYPQWKKDGAARLAKFLKRTAGDPTYISFDIDCVDPAYAPGTGTPSMGGFTSAEALENLRSLAGVNVVGGDVVEVLPDRDAAGITALLAAHVAYEIIMLRAVRERR